MRVVGLISGGKDSCYNLMQCVASGHTIVALANIEPHNRTEIDSYMYQSVGHEAIEMIAQSMQLPLFRRQTFGTSYLKELTYVPTENDEVEDLFNVLKQAKGELNIEAVSVGAILSDYQRLRVENVCSRLDLVPLAYLWKRDQNELLQEMIKCGLDAVIIKVAALGLEPSRHLGRPLRLVEPHLQVVKEKYGVNLCGEGGEYETLVLDCPLYSSRIIIEESEVVLQSDDPIAPVGFLKLNKLKLEEKLPQLDLHGRLNNIPLKDSDGYITDQGEEAIEFMEEDVNEVDGCEEVTNDTLNETNCCQFEQPITCAKSSDGWLSLGGIAGYSDDYQSAAIQTLGKLKSVLEINNQRLVDVVSVTLFISDMSQFALLNKLYVDVLNHINPPSRACIQVPLSKDCPIILDALSWSPHNDTIGDSQIHRNTLHVQSVSHWAPANIGPYSQAVQVGELIHLSGLIGLVPGSMELVKGGIKYQCQLTLKHMGRILNAVDSNINLRDVVQGICYLTNFKHIEKARKCWEAKTNNAIVDYVIVSALPKNALVEWHVWAHRHNGTFEYEETGKCSEDWSISIYRRSNFENKIAAIVCRLEHTKDLSATLTYEICEELFEYILNKLQQGHESDSLSICNLKIFYNIKKGTAPLTILNVLKKFQNTTNLVYTLIPVFELYTEHTYVSICGVRIQ